MSRTIMLIHGAWLTPRSWDRFRDRYEAEGYTVLTPAWPHLDGAVPSLRQDPPPALSKLGVRQIVDHYETIIRALPEPPILMGHSFGGLFVQLLLDRGLGAAGVAIDSVPPFGVRASLTAALSSIGVFTAWNGWNRTLRMSLRTFSRSFAQTLPEAEKPAAYDKHIVPTPGRIFFQALLGIGTRVDWSNPDRPPLLLVVGSEDRTVTPSMVRTNYEKQRRAGSPTAFHEFRGRSHWLCDEAGWDEVADLALSNAIAHLPAHSAPEPIAQIAAA